MSSFIVLHHLPGRLDVHGGSPVADYAEALDPADLGRTYTETDIPIEEGESDAEEILNILLGGDTE